MTPRLPRLVLLSLLWLAPLAAQHGDLPADDGRPAGAIATTLAEAGEDVRLYNDHVTTLANPFLQGRLPGTPGMEFAKDYAQFWLERAGLSPAFAEVEHAEGNPWRQPFEMTAAPVAREQGLAVGGRELDLAPGVEARALAAGASGSVTGPLVFVGYSIEEGPDGYRSYGPHDDLTGAIALMLRFEPMDDAGRSLWSEHGRWTSRADFTNKLRAARERGAAGVILVNSPGADDARAARLPEMTAAGEAALVEGPLLALTAEAGDRLLAACDDDAPTVAELRRAADGGHGMLDLGARVTLRAEIARETFTAENVGGLLPGRGRLADELLVVGAHLDHIGLGERYGVGDRTGEVHAGADDNASGSAAVLLLADALRSAYAALPEGRPVRSVLFLLFSAEESGLVGSKHYVGHPISPIERHALMINLDMIGRIRDGRFSLSGAGTAESMHAWLDAIAARSPLVVDLPEDFADLRGSSDHASFIAADVPALFGMNTDTHSDYHAPGDLAWKINREDAVAAVHLVRDVALAAAMRGERFEFVAPAPAPAPHPAPGDPAVAASPADSPGLGRVKVRFGIAPGSYQSDEPGVLVGSVYPDTSAGDAGVLRGDRLMTWNGTPIMSVEDWMGMLSLHEPGDVVEVGIRRDGEDIVLPVKLYGRTVQG